MPHSTLTRRYFLRGAAIAGAAVFLGASSPADDKWRKLLTPEQYHILRENETEPPNSSPLIAEHRPEPIIASPAISRCSRRRRNTTAVTAGPVSEAAARRAAHEVRLRTGRRADRSPLCALRRSLVTSSTTDPNPRGCGTASTASHCASCRGLPRSLERAAVGAGYDIVQRENFDLLRFANVRTERGREVKLHESRAEPIAANHNVGFVVARARSVCNSLITSNGTFSSALPAVCCHLSETKNLLPFGRIATISALCLPPPGLEPTNTCFCTAYCC